MDWPLLASLDADERAAVIAAARRHTFRKGEVVFHEGDPADSMHLVAAGHLAVQVSTPDGERVTLNVLSPGDSVGELSLVRRGAPERRSATVVALDAAETRVLGMGVFQELCQSHPGVQDLMVAALADRVRDLSARLLEQMYVGLDRRLYRRLLDLAEMYADGATAVVPLDAGTARRPGRRHPAHGQPGAATAAGRAGDRARPGPADRARRGRPATQGRTGVVTAARAARTW